MAHHEFQLLSLGMLSWGAMEPALWPTLCLWAWAVLVESIRPKFSSAAYNGAAALVAVLLGLGLDVPVIDKALLFVIAAIFIVASVRASGRESRAVHGKLDHLAVNNRHAVRARGLKAARGLFQTFKAYDNQVELIAILDSKPEDDPDGSRRAQAIERRYDADVAASEQWIEHRDEAAAILAELRHLGIEIHHNAEQLSLETTLQVEDIRRVAHGLYLAVSKLSEQIDAGKEA